jgi:hypothetical protein
MLGRQVKILTEWQLELLAGTALYVAQPAMRGGRRARNRLAETRSHAELRMLAR